MASMEAQADQQACTKRNTDFRRLDAAWWFAWMQEQVEWQDVLGRLRWEGEAQPSKGLPRREYAPHELEALAGDRDRARRYASRARRLGAVLPPELRRLVPSLVVDYRRVLPIEIRGGRSLTPDDAARLREVCLRSLRREALSRGERLWRDRALQR